MDRVVDVIGDYANTSAASIPIALARAAADGRLEPGQRLLLAAFGAGFTWGALVVDWGLDGRTPPGAGELQPESDEQETKEGPRSHA